MICHACAILYFAVLSLNLKSRNRVIMSLIFYLKKSNKIGRVNLKSNIWLTSLYSLLVFLFACTILYFVVLSLILKSINRYIISLIFHLKESTKIGRVRQWWHKQYKHDNITKQILHLFHFTWKIPNFLLSKYIPRTFLWWTCIITVDLGGLLPLAFSFCTANYTSLISFAFDVFHMNDTLYVCYYHIVLLYLSNDDLCQVNGTSMWLENAKMFLVSLKIYLSSKIYFASQTCDQLNFPILNFLKQPTLCLFYLEAQRLIFSF